MAIDANRCPNCGAERPANAPEGYCPSCLLKTALNSDAPGQVDVDATAAPATTSSGDEPETSSGVFEATGPYIPGPAAGAASSPSDTTGNRTTDSDDPSRTTELDSPTRTAVGHSDSHDLSRGATVRYFGDYEILKELGRGGMGVVYKARQVSLNRPVALKMIKIGALADDADLRRFQNEAEAVALLDHPGIVPVYEVGEHEGQRYFSMKLVDGGNLAERLASFRDNPRAAVSLMIEAAEAIQHAHTRGILDRDLKPANILIDTQGRPHITDFGLAKLMQTDFELTASGAIMGTPAYMSPEQAAGRREEMSLVTDVYGLGAIFYALLTGKAPFGGDSVIETLDAGHNPQRLQVSSLIGSLPSCMPGSPRASSARNDLASHLAGACRILSPVKEDRMLRVVPDRSYRPIEILNDHAAGPLDKGPHPEVVRPVAHQVVPCFWDVGAKTDSQ